MQTVDDRVLMVTWPAAARVGDSEIISLDFSPAAQNDPYDPPLRSTEAALAARLELPGVRYSPQGEITQALVIGRPVRFSWTIYPERAGESTAMVWIHLVRLPAGSNADRIVVSAQRLEMQANSFFGISGPWARSMGAAGVIIGAVLGLDGVASHLIKAIKSDKDKIIDNHLV